MVEHLFTWWYLFCFGLLIDLETSFELIEWEEVLRDEAYFFNPSDENEEEYDKWLNLFPMQFPIIKSRNSNKISALMLWENKW